MCLFTRAVLDDLISQNELTTLYLRHRDVTSQSGLISISIDAGQA